MFFGSSLTSMAATLLAVLLAITLHELAHGYAAYCLGDNTAKADYIKTSTGFGSAGATVEDVALFRKECGADVKIKAAGGIRTVEDAEKMLEAGADRLGSSALLAK